MYEESNVIKLPTICNVVILIQYAYCEITIAYAYLWLIPGWEKIFGLILFGFYSFLCLCSLGFTYEAIHLICKWLKTDNTIFIFILSLIIPFISLLFTVKTIDGDIPGLFDPRFID